MLLCLHRLHNSIRGTSLMYSPPFPIYYATARRRYSIFSSCHTPSRFPLPSILCRVAPQPSTVHAPLFQSWRSTRRLLLACLPKGWARGRRGRGRVWVVSEFVRLCWCGSCCVSPCATTATACTEISSDRPTGGRATGRKGRDGDDGKKRIGRTCLHNGQT